MSKSEQAVYSHGHHASVVSVHARRTAQNSAQFLLPHIQPHFRILDLGCGPGTITADLAALVPQGSVVGVDAVESILDRARSLADSRGLKNLTYEAGDGNNLRFKDGEFDIVFCHQLVQHVNDPVGVLKEMRRVCRNNGGIVAAREADYLSFSWRPRPKEFDRWMDIYQKVAFANGGQPNAGRVLPQWTREAGMSKDNVKISWGSWCFTGKDASDWATSWQGRVVASDFAKGAVKHEIATQEELQEISEVWRKWANDEIEGCEDKIFVVGNGELIYHC